MKGLRGARRLGNLQPLRVTKISEINAIILQSLVGGAISRYAGPV